MPLLFLHSHLSFLSTLEQPLRWQAFRLHRQDELHDAGKLTPLFVRVAVKPTIVGSPSRLVISVHASVPTLSPKDAIIDRCKCSDEILTDHR